MLDITNYGLNSSPHFKSIIMRQIRQTDLKRGDRFSVAQDQPTYEVLEKNGNTATVRRLGNGQIDHNQPLTNDIVNVF